MEKEMRRKDRKITSQEDIRNITRQADVCRIAMVDENATPYIVPMNFGYEWSEKVLTLYFHGAGEGKKIDILKNNPLVCYEMECNTAIKKAEDSAQISYYYMSLIGTGNVEFVEDEDEKCAALKCLVCKYMDADMDINKVAASRTTVFRIVSTSYSGKQHIAK